MENLVSAEEALKEATVEHGEESLWKQLESGETMTLTALRRVLLARPPATRGEFLYSSPCIYRRARFAKDWTDTFEVVSGNHL